MSKLKDWILKWFHGSNKPIVAEVVIKATAAGLHEAVRDIIKLDGTYTKDSALDAILNEYKK
jgi:hypothetical protein